MLAREALCELAGLSDGRLARLRDDVFSLPQIDLSLHVKLPELAGAERKRLQRAIVDTNDDGSWDTVTAMARRVDSPRERLRLAESVTELRRQGRVGRLAAAVAIYDLGNGGRYFVTTSTVHALATQLGGDPTPGGLLVAA
jgi:hypothetical protein